MKNQADRRGCYLLKLQWSIRYNSIKIIDTLYASNVSSHSTASAREARSEAPYVIKFGKLSIQGKFGYDVTVRPSVCTTVRTFRVGVSRNEFLYPLPLRVLFQKPLKMIDKSESVNWPNVWWILGADHLTFEGGMSDFRKKCPARWFREEKRMQVNSSEKTSCTEKNIAHDVYCWKKNLTPLYLGGKICNSREVWEKTFKLNQ